MSPVHRHPRLRAVNSAELYRRCEARLKTAEQARLWGLHVQRGAVTLIIGTTSVGKTSLLHNLGFTWAGGAEFLGVTPPGPLKVLYVDFESHDGVLFDHFQTIGTHPKLDFLEPEDLLRGRELVEALKELVTRDRYDVVVVDPLMDAYPVENENDNAQAIEQMLAFRALARQTNAAVVVVHNAGRKAEEIADDSAFLGRGASARADKADVSINFVRDPVEPGTHRILVVSKSRQRNLRERIRFRFAGQLGYELADDDSPTPADVVQLARDAFAFVQGQSAQGGRLEISRREIQEYLQLSGSGRDKKRLTRALARACEEEWLVKPRDGFYALPGTPGEDEDAPTYDGLTMPGAE